MEGGGGGGGGVGDSQLKISSSARSGYLILWEGGDIHFLHQAVDLTNILDHYFKLNAPLGVEKGTLVGKDPSGILCKAP